MLSKQLEALAANDRSKQKDSVYTQISDKRAKMKARLSKLDNSCFEAHKSLQLSNIRELEGIPSEDIMRWMEAKMAKSFAEARFLDEQYLLIAYQHMNNEKS